MQRHTQHVPVIMLSANLDAVVIARAARTDGLLTRHFAVDEVLRIIQQPIPRVV